LEIDFNGDLVSDVGEGDDDEEEEEEDEERHLEGDFGDAWLWS